MSEVNEIPLNSYVPCHQQPSNRSGGKAVKRRSRRKKGRKKAKGYARFKTVRHAKYRYDKGFRPHEVQDLLDAATFAGRIGQPLTAAITLMWPLTAGGEADIPRRWRKFYNAFSQWLKRQGYEWTAVWAHENPPDKGFNTHLSVHLPDHMHGPVTDWLTRYFGGHPNAVDLRPGTFERYGLKGTDLPTVMRHQLFGKNGGWKGKQGSIVGMARGGCTSNINRTAREQFSRDFVANYATRVREAAGVLKPIRREAHADGP